ncbi:hypothetical protein PMAYCL1PPCAC_31961 [Pristionchus mayeri]|uniref:Inward rectifier potassium channel C-terminal domain-containing protein n=1 Tax=Pristionchus mayeri TaxID=1317129 RepID=A0AAN5DEY4_9BILA|nr:hypothetical protein PMAYCL1PPCAC_31961 [Pristionchus mayeri]
MQQLCRYPTDECTLVVLTMCVQFMWGVMSQTLMAGVIFSKLARPIKRAATLIFSKNAVICLRDGKLCLLFRVGDMRKSSLAEAHVRLQMIKRCITYEGELLPFHQFDMDVGYDQGLDRVFVIWPITICHEIDERSPLYEVSMESLQTAKFEIIAILEGVVESVGSTTQARTSYLPSEILWGKRFEKLVHYKKENGQYNIDFSKFHNVYDIKTPTCSAKKLEEMRLNGEFDEREYHILPPDGRGCIRLLDDNHLIDPASEPAEQTETDEPPEQILRIDSDVEDNDTDEGNLELVDYGFRKKSICVDKKLSVRSSHMSLAQSPSRTSSFFFRSPHLEGTEQASTSAGCRCTANGCEGANVKRYSNTLDTLQPPSPHVLRHINSLPPSPTEKALSTSANEVILPIRPVSHMTYRVRDRVSSAGSATSEIPTDESRLVDGF